MNKLSPKHNRWIKFGPKHHPLHHEKQGSDNHQVKPKAARWERNGKIVSAPRSRKTPCVVGWGTSPVRTTYDRG